MLTRRQTIVAMACAALLPGAPAGAQDKAQDKLHVIASFSILGDLVKNVGGERLQVGTLLAVGIMMLPAAIGRFWARDVTLMILIATASGAAAGYAGLLLSFHTGVASGPAIILVAGALYVVSLLFGRVGGLVRQAFPGRHLEA